MGSWAGEERTGIKNRRMSFVANRIGGLPKKKLGLNTEDTEEEHREHREEKKLGGLRS